MKMKVRVPSDKEVLFVKVKVINVKHPLEVLEIINPEKIEGIDLPPFPMLKKYSKKKKKISLFTFGNVSKKEIKKYVEDFWKSHAIK
jgi:hypothetical protein